MNFSENLETQALEYILDMPDDLFRTVYPTMVEELKKSVENEAQTTFENGISENERTAMIENIENCEQLLESDEVNELSIEKRNFIQLILEIAKDNVANIPYRDSIHVPIQLCRDTATVPTYANPTDAGCDVYAAASIDINVGETVIVPTGLKVAIPIGWMISIRPRSGMSLSTSLRIANAPGTIDSFYRDEIGIIIHNTGTEIAHIKTGDRIAQMVIEKCPSIKFDIVDDINLIKGNRGGGYGSSGI